MAKALDIKLKPHSNAVYPWAEWFDGRTWELEPGVDFKLSTTSFRALVYGAAVRKGLLATTHVVDGKMLIQARAK